MCPVPFRLQTRRAGFLRPWAGSDHPCCSRSSLSLGPVVPRSHAVPTPCSGPSSARPSSWGHLAVGFPSTLAPSHFGVTWPFSQAVIWPVSVFTFLLRDRRVLDRNPGCKTTHPFGYRLSRGTAWDGPSPVCPWPLPTDPESTGRSTGLAQRGEGPAGAGDTQRLV